MRRLKTGRKLFKSAYLCIVCHARTIKHYSFSQFSVHLLRSRSFYHLDPRWQILTFFNDLALKGTFNLEEESGGIVRSSFKYQIPYQLRIFNRVGVLSVWRPTSNEAIKYMMTGEGVGKGLDIKGKSAKKGKYSGFVPFVSF